MFPLPSARPHTALVVEDDPGVAAMLRRHLVRAGFLVYEAPTERDAVRRAGEVAPDVVLLDLLLPDGSGASVCERLRSQPALGDVPILVLTARDELATKVGLFAIGADDYVVKPCEPAELLARIDALLRRRSEAQTARRIGPLRVALATGDAWLGNVLLDLTAAERVVLSELARAWPGIARRQTLERFPWERHTRGSNVLEVLIARLRRKLADAGGGLEIRAIRRSGYTIDVRSGQWTGEGARG